MESIKLSQKNTPEKLELTFDELKELKTLVKAAATSLPSDNLMNLGCVESVVRYNRIDLIEDRVKTLQKNAEKLNCLIVAEPYVKYSNFLKESRELPKVESKDINLSSLYAMAIFSTAMWVIMILGFIISKAQ